MDKKQETPVNDELVLMHLKARKRHRRKLMVTMTGIVLVVIVVIVVGVSYARNRISEQFASSGSSSVETAEVTVGSISTTVSGSGTLMAENTENVEIPLGLEIADFYVEEGDTVEEGDLIATVTASSMLTALSELQEELDAIDAELEDAADDEVNSTIAAGVSGRVKKIYAVSGDDVTTAMYEYGALMLLSLDGYMAVDVETDTLEAGESVTVESSGGDTFSGTVDKIVDGTATILVTDKGTDYEDMVTVYDMDGNPAGSGALYIHSPMEVTGYAGTISAVNVSENASVSSGTTLFSLTDTETSVNYDTLLKEREELEYKMTDLIRIKKEGGIYAPIAGTVESLSGSQDSSVDQNNTEGQAVSSDTSTEQSSMGNQSASSDYTTVAGISPNNTMSVTISVDESDILSLSEGLEAGVTIESIGEDTYMGYVSEISTTANAGSGVTSYSTIVTIDKTEDMLSGMSATVVITIEGVDNALLIPVDALYRTRSTSYVYTEYDESAGEFSGMVEVATGLSNSSYVEITSGLSEGDTVYYAASDDDSSFGGMGGDMGSFGGMGGDMGRDNSGGNMPDGNSGGGMQGMPGK